MVDSPQAQTFKNIFYGLSICGVAIAAVYVAYLGTKNTIYRALIGNISLNKSKSSKCISFKIKSDDRGFLVFFGTTEVGNISFGNTENQNLEEEDLNVSQKKIFSRAFIKLIQKRKNFDIYVDEKFKVLELYGFLNTKIPTYVFNLDLKPDFKIETFKEKAKISSNFENFIEFFEDLICDEIFFDNKIETESYTHKEIQEYNTLIFYLYSRLFSDFYFLLYPNYIYITNNKDKMIMLRNKNYKFLKYLNDEILVGHRNYLSINTNYEEIREKVVLITYFPWRLLIINLSEKEFYTELEPQDSITTAKTGILDHIKYYFSKMFKKSYKSKSIESFYKNDFSKRISELKEIKDVKTEEIVNISNNIAVTRLES